MVQTVSDGKIEQYEKAMPKNYWLRNKKQTINLLHDSPFTIDRQLEDQRFSQERNRNPQYYMPTKVDKVRSETIIAKKGSSRPVAVKANVINKIVREASGVHNYTIVAPPRELVPLRKSDLENQDPETNPRMYSYANEAKQKPVLCSFGHRPSSASRTFHPATMKFRLKHGEIASDNNKTGFGLPVAVLAQVLHAPKITLPGATSIDSHTAAMPSTKDINQRHDYNDLFFTPQQQADMFEPAGIYDRKQSKSVMRTTQSGGAAAGGGELEEYSMSKASWVSSQGHSIPRNKRNEQLAPLSARTAISIVDNARPVWDEAHHRVAISNAEVFAMRQSGLNDLAQQPLAEKLNRFAKLAVAESQFVPFCTEKQETDKLIRSGVVHKVPKSKPIKGHSLYYDPWDVELAEVKKYRKELDQKMSNKYRASKYQDNLSTVPDVNYYPTTVLAKIQKEKSKMSPTKQQQQQQQQQKHPHHRQQEQSESHEYKPLNLLNFSYPMEFVPPPNQHQESRAMSNSYTSSGGGIQDDGTNLHEESIAMMEASQLTASTTVTGSRSRSAGHLGNSKGSPGKIIDNDMDWLSFERDSRAAMRAAKRGDTKALYSVHMAPLFDELRLQQQQYQEIESPQQQKWNYGDEEEYLHYPHEIESDVNGVNEMMRENDEEDN